MPVQEQQQQRRVEQVVEPTPIAPVQDFGSNQDQLAQLRATPAPQEGLLDGLLTEQDEKEEEPKSSSPTLTVSVKVDPKFDERRMREEILRGPPFFYSDADLARLAKQSDDLFFLTHQGGDGSRATAEQIGTWGKPGQAVAIPIPGDRVEALLRFKLSPLLWELRDGMTASTGQKMSDLVVRAMAGDLGAADELALLAQQEPLVRNATLKIAEDPSATRSAALQLAAARMLGSQVKPLPAPDAMGPVVPDAEREQQLVEVRSLVQRATTLSGGLDRTSAAQLNLQAAALYRQLGLAREADEREMIARMYLSTEQERRMPLLRIDRTPPGQTVMQAAKPQDLALQDWYRKNPTLDPSKTVKTRTEIGARADASEPQISVPVNELGTQRRQQDGTRTTTRVSVPTGRTIEANQSGLTGAKNAGGAGNLLQQVQVWGRAHKGMMELASKLAERDRLQQDAKMANTWARPPKLDEVLRVRGDFDRQFPKDSTDPAVVEMRRQLTLVEEASRAFYGGN